MSKQVLIPGGGGIAIPAVTSALEDRSALTLG